MSQGPPPTPPQHGLPPTSQPFPGSLTPGWNDPPSIQYNSQSTGTPGRTKLNKRVPFPLQQTNAGITTKPTAIVQPCQTGPATSNIAVVHPLQHTNQESPARTLPPAPPVIMPEPPITLPRESGSQNPVPTMFVPAVPRQEDSQGTVQHL